MTHAEMNELYELYVLGALEPEEAAAINEHVNTACEYCLAHIREASAVTSAMAAIAEQHEPPAHLRERIVRSVSSHDGKQQQSTSRRSSWIFAVAGLSAAVLALLVFVVWGSLTMQEYRHQIANLEQERTQLREAVEILSKSDTRTVQFGRAEQPHGRVFVNRNNGLVFVGSQLPALASNRTFQLWLVPAAGAPESVGLFRPNAAGTFVNVRTTPVDLTRFQAIAVSVEPPGGSPAPSTTPILVVPLA